MGKSKRPVLSISILASNRPDTIRRCLDSLKPIMEQIPSELILVDTSENEDIRRILLEYTEQVIPFHWCRDFSKARNAGLKKATGEWFLFLDDDEWFLEYEPLVEFFRSGECAQYGCANYLVRNYYNTEHTRFVDTWASRMVRRYDDTHFESKIHEYLVPVRGECQNISARVGHTGYIYRTEAEKAAHFERNASLIKEMIRLEPERMRWRVQLIQEYRAAGKYAEVTELCETYLDEFRDVTEEMDVMDYGTLYVASADASDRLGRYEDVVCMADAGIGDSRMNESCRAYLYLLRASAKESLGNRGEAEDGVRHYMQLFEDLKEKPRRRERQQASLIVAEVFEPFNLRRAGDILSRINGLCGENSGPEAELARWMEGKAEFLRFDERYWELAKEGAFSLEDMLLALPLSQWIALVHVLDREKDSEKWQDAVAHLETVRQKENIRYKYFYMHFYNAAAEAGIVVEDPAQIAAFLQEFSRWNAAFVREVYTDAALEGEMDMIPESCRCALYLERALACTEEEWSEKLEYLGLAVKAWPTIGSVIKVYVRLLGEEKERRNAAAHQVQDELLQMKAAVLKNIPVLVANGLQAEALAAIKQLRGMLPEDQELAAYESELEAEIRKGEGRTV